MVDPHEHKRREWWSGEHIAQQRVMQKREGGSQYLLYILGALNKAGAALLMRREEAAFWKSWREMVGRESWAAGEGRLEESGRRIS
eukprot:2370375-Ditylum_brightwellii.AAC.1